MDMKEIAVQTSLTWHEFCVCYSVATEGYSVYGGEDAIPDFPPCVYSSLDSSPAPLPPANQPKVLTDIKAAITNISTKRQPADGK